MESEGGGSVDAPRSLRLLLSRLLRRFSYLQGRGERGELHLGRGDPDQSRSKVMNVPIKRLLLVGSN